jgi:hypothetical protein
LTAGTSPSELVGMELLALVTGKFSKLFLAILESSFSASGRIGARLRDWRG